MTLTNDSTGGGDARDILVIYQDSPAALVGPTRFSFLGDVRHLPPGDPVVRVVTHMGYYAQLVLTRRLPGPYTHEDAERFARYALVDPAELSRLADESDAALASAFRVPPAQIRLARQDLGDPDAG